MISPCHSITFRVCIVRASGARRRKLTRPFWNYAPARAPSAATSLSVPVVTFLFSLIEHKTLEMLQWEHFCVSTRDSPRYQLLPMPQYRKAIVAITWMGCRQMCPCRRTTLSSTTNVQRKHITGKHGSVAVLFCNNQFFEPHERLQ